MGRAEISTSYPLFANNVLCLDQFRYTDLSTNLRGITPCKLCSYSPEPRAEVYCLRLNFNISKLVYWYLHRTTSSFCEKTKLINITSILVKATSTFQAERLRHRAQNYFYPNDPLRWQPFHVTEKKAKLRQIILHINYLHFHIEYSCLVKRGHFIIHSIALPSQWVFVFLTRCCLFFKTMETLHCLLQWTDTVQFKSCKLCVLFRDALFKTANHSYS